MPIVRSYGLPEVEARPLPNAAPNVAAAGDLASFGGNQARDLQVAGQQLDRAADNVFNIYERQAKEVNDTQVDSSLNSFIAAKQKTLADFVQLKGQAAVDASKATTDNLLKLKSQILDGSPNAYQRDVLSKRLDLQLNDATGTITAHTANQAAAWQKDTLNAQSTLADREGVMKRDDPAAIDAMLKVKEAQGIEAARLQGATSPDDPVSKAEVAKKQSDFLIGVIDAKIKDGNKRAALALYDKHEGILKPNSSVAAVMKGVREDIDAENDANSALAKVGLPQIRSGSETEQTGRDESGGNYGAINPRSGAFGKYQFMADTWASVSKAHPELGLPFNMRQATPAQQEAAKRALDQDNAKVLQAKGVPTTDANMYLAHRFGAEGAASFLKAPDDAPVAKVLPASWVDQNPDLQGVTVGQFKAGVAKRYDTGFPSMGAPVFKGDLRAGYEQAKAELQARTDITPERRAKAMAMLNATASNVTSYVDAKTKALKDRADSFRLRGYLDPSQLDPAKLASFADEAAALGNQSLAETYRMYASLAPTLKNGLQSAPADVIKMLKSIEEGPAKKLLEGMDSGREETLTRANDLFDKVKKGQADGLNPAGLADMAKQAAQLYADAGKSEKAREVARTYGAMINAAGVLQADPVAQKQALAEMEGIANKGQINEEQATYHGLLKDGIARQQSEFQKDAFAAGQRLYAMPTLPITDGAGRVQQADEIARRRGLQPGSIAPLSEEEFAQIRDHADRTTPQGQQQLFQDIATRYPAASIPLIAAGISGKGLADPTTQGYAAALSFYADKEPDVAATILDGVSKRRTMGDALRDMPKGDVFQRVVQDRVGNAFKNLPGNVPAIIVKAAEAIYTSKMIAAGRQNEKALDETVFQQALDAVSGRPITRNGQMFVPPKGVEPYQVDGALRQFESANLPGLTTLNGSPVTADKIVRYGMLSNAGADGLYLVEMPDPARGGRPAYVQGPDGKPFVLDLKPLLERAKQFPPVLPNETEAGAARRRAPASPTANVEP